MLTLSIFALTLAASGFGSVQAQEEFAAPAQAQAAPSGADWNIVSRSSHTVFMTDVNGVKQTNGVTIAQVARVPASGDTGNLSHSVTELSFRCSANQSKAGEEVYYAADGSVEERIPNDLDFEPIPANSLDAYVKAVVCGGDRSPKSFPSVAAFIAAGRPTRD
ncbi:MULTISPECIES: hypothetical protein [Brevundimonas]|uniref:hypothetical protein n=1 Tax=Brevundimonas pishanensis TaxID=2896315 RepID=UPI001FA7FCF0|nr:hypothetical protein [Brevundimonas pishanensis]